MSEETGLNLRTLEIILHSKISFYFRQFFLLTGLQQTMSSAISQVDIDPYFMLWYLN